MNSSRNGTLRRLTNTTICVPLLSSPAGVPILATSTISQEIAPNHVIIKVDTFGFSANNVTYQALGGHSQFRYFDFHRAPVDVERGVSPETHGVVPVWGFGTIVQSTHSKIPLGERVYGYFAPAKYLLLPVNQVNKYVFYVPREHLPPDRRPYNQITRCATDPQYTPTQAGEALTMLYRPLFWTAFWCEDYMHEEGLLGSASTVLISSASAKTAICLAWCLRRRISQGGLDSKVTLIGLTSPESLDYVKNIGLYDLVLIYSSFPSSPTFSSNAGSQWVYVDVAGNDAFNQGLVAHFSPGDDLRAWISLGLTNLSPGTTGVSPGIDPHILTKAGKPGKDSSSTVIQSPTPFFTPIWLETRKRQLSPAAISSMQNGAWSDLMTDCNSWGEIEHTKGAGPVRDLWEKMINEKGTLGRAKGMVWSMWGDDSVGPLNETERHNDNVHISAAGERTRLKPLL